MAVWLPAFLACSSAFCWFSSWCHARFSLWNKFHTATLLAHSVLLFMTALNQWFNAGRAGQFLCFFTDILHFFQCLDRCKCCIHPLNSKFSCCAASEPAAALTRSSVKFCLMKNGCVQEVRSFSVIASSVILLCLYNSLWTIQGSVRRLEPP